MNARKAHIEDVLKIEEKLQKFKKAKGSEKPALEKEMPNFMSKRLKLSTSAFLEFMFGARLILHI